MDTSGHLPWKVRSVRLSSRCPDPRGAGIINHESEFATGLLVPAGTPADIIRFLQAQIAQIAALPDVRERLGTLGFDPIGSTSDEFGAWIKAETTKWAPIVRAANVSIN